MKNHCVSNSVFVNPWSRSKLTALNNQLKWEETEDGAKPNHESYHFTEIKSFSFKRIHDTLLAKDFCRFKAKTFYPNSDWHFKLTSYEKYLFSKNSQNKIHSVNSNKMALRYFKQKAVAGYPNIVALKGTNPSIPQAMKVSQQYIFHRIVPFEQVLWLLWRNQTIYEPSREKKQLMKELNSQLQSEHQSWAVSLTSAKAFTNWSGWGQALAERPGGEARHGSQPSEVRCQLSFIIETPDIPPFSTLTEHQTFWPYALPD